MTDLAPQLEAVEISIDGKAPPPPAPKPPCRHEHFLIAWEVKVYNHPDGRLAGRRIGLRVMCGDCDKQVAFHPDPDTYRLLEDGTTASVRMLLGDEQP